MLWVMWVGVSCISCPVGGLAVDPTLVVEKGAPGLSGLILAPTCG